ncbi:MAG: ARMT1-like domain-containing protein [Phycisphaerales bacterium]
MESRGSVFPLLADPATYRACEHDLLADADGRAYWLDLFTSHIAVQVDHAESAGLIDAAGGAKVIRALQAEIDEIRRQPDRQGGQLDILVLDAVRRTILYAAGIRDEFRQVKADENRRALTELAARLHALDDLPSGEQAVNLVAGLVAGNLFDMGAKATAEVFASGASDAERSFAASLARVPARPWCFDDVDRAAAWIDAPPGPVMIFLDNAGADVVLGALPLARHLAKRGADVRLVANRDPALNDVTAPEAERLLAAAAKIDAVFGAGRITVIDGGNDAPLIDLLRVTPACARAASDAGLLVLLGMGRAIESNWTARFTVPVIRVAMLKDPQVAARVGGRMFGAVCRAEG